MADTTLRLGFRDANGASVVYSYKYADPMKAANVKPLMQSMIANSAFFVRRPASIDFAEYVSTNVLPVSI